MIQIFNVGIKGVVRVGNKCLVLKAVRENGSYWDIPGGRIDESESIEETLHRELQEELPDIKTYTIGGIVGAYRLSKNLPDGKGLVLVFYRVDAEEFDINLSNEHSAYKWVSKQDVTDLLSSRVPIEKGYYDAIVSALS